MKSNKWRIVFIATIIIGGAVSLFASAYPDGLNKIAETQGFIGNATQITSGIMPQYQAPGVHSASLSKSLSGIIGVCLVFAILFLAGKLMYRSETTGK